MLFDNVQIPITYSLIDTPKKLSWLCQTLKQSNEFAYDIETNHPTIKNKETQILYRKKYPIFVIGISFAWGRDKVEKPWQSGFAAYVPLMRQDDQPFWGSRQQAVINALKEVLETRIPKVAHNGKFDNKELVRRLSIKVMNLKFDTYLAHAMLDEERLTCSHALKSDFDGEGNMIKLGCADAYLDIAASAFKKGLKDALKYYDPQLERYSKVPLDVIYPYACADADLTLSLRFVFDEMLKKENLDWCFNNIVMKLQHAVMKLEFHGCPLNIPIAKKVEQDQLSIQKELEPKIYEIVGKQFLVSSNEQLGDVLFNYLKLPGGRRNKTGWIVDSAVLKSLNHPICDPVLKYRRANKIQATYATSSLNLVEEVEGDIGWVHPQIWLDSLTGRLKTENPNLTNLPKKESGGEIVKGMWQADEDHKIIFSDFSQFELRVTAHVSGEPTWIEGFKNGHDMHAATAKSVFKLDATPEEIEKYHKPERSKAKTINFSIIYGKGIWNLSKDLGISIEEAEKMVNIDYFGAAPILKNYVDFVHDFVEKNGYVSNIFGRRRHLIDAQLVVPHTVRFPDDRPPCYRQMVSPETLNVMSNDLYDIKEETLRQLVKFKRISNKSCADCSHIKSCFVNAEVKRISATKARAMRQSLNSIVQGSAADMSSLALVWIGQEFLKNNVRSSPILYIHDEIGCYTHNEDIDKARQIMEECMTKRLETFTNFSVPITVDTKIVRNWGDK